MNTDSAKAAVSPRLSRQMRFSNALTRFAAPVFFLISGCLLFAGVRAFLTGGR